MRQRKDTLRELREEERQYMDDFFGKEGIFSAEGMSKGFFLGFWFFSFVILLLGLFIEPAKKTTLTEDQKRRVIRQLGHFHSRIDKITTVPQHVLGSEKVVSGPININILL